jgi:hypothetical protein
MNSYLFVSVGRTHLNPTTETKVFLSEIDAQRDLGILNIDEPAVLIITYAGTPGVQTSVPANGEKAEY